MYMLFSYMSCTLLPVSIVHIIMEGICNTVLFPAQIYFSLVFPNSVVRETLGYNRGVWLAQHQLLLLRSDENESHAIFTGDI